MRGEEGVWDFRRAEGTGLHIQKDAGPPVLDLMEIRARDRDELPMSREGAISNKPPITLTHHLGATSPPS